MKDQLRARMIHVLPKRFDSRLSNNPGNAQPRIVPATIFASNRRLA
jgi:hypothetical protein